MLQKMRAGAQTLGAKVLAGIICFVLVVFGFGAFNLFAVSPPAVVKVNGEDITESQFTQAAVVQRRSYLNTYGDLTPEDVERIISDELVLTRLINNVLVKQKAKEIGFGSSKKEFVDRLQSNPAFQEDGEFDPERFVRVVTNVGFSPASYEAQTREDYVIERLVRIEESSSFVTEREIRDGATIAAETRDIAYVEFNSNNFLQFVQPTDEEILAHYEENPDDYMTTEEFEVAYIVVDRAAFESGIEVTDEDVLNAYEAEKAVMESDARRRASHILLNVDDERTVEDATRELLEVRQRVMDGESFSEFAMDMSDDLSSGLQGGDLGFNGRGIYVPEFEAALFNLEVEEISEPVETQFGVHIIQLHEIEEVEIPPFEERAEELRSNLIGELATPEYEEAVTEAERLAWEHPDSLEPAATALGLEIQTQASVTGSNGEGLLEPISVRSGLLVGDVVDNGFNSPAVQASDSQTIFGRVVSISPPKLQPLEEVERRIWGYIRSMEARRLAEEARDEAFERINEVDDYSVISDEFEVEWVTLDRSTRDRSDVDYTITDAAFGLRLDEDGEREILSVDVSPIEFAIVVVSRMNPGDYDELPSSQQISVEEALSTEFKSLGLDSYIASLRNEAKIKHMTPQATTAQ